MVVDWSAKELLAAVKMTQLSVPKYSVTEEQAIIDGQRLAGMINFNTDDKRLQVYQSGTGTTFDKTVLSNYLFRDKTNIGITTPKQTVYDEKFVNEEGKMNTSIFVSLEYLQETSIAGEIEIVLTDGVTPITNTDTLASDGSPVKKYITYELAATSFALDDVLQIQVKLTQVQIEFVEMRGI